LVRRPEEEVITNVGTFAKRNNKEVKRFGLTRELGVINKRFDITL